MESVESTIRAYFEALNRSDVDGVVALFAEDGSLLPDERPTATGHEALRRTFEGTFQQIRLYRELHIDEIREESGVAVARTHTTGTLTPVAADAAVPLASRELFVLRRAGADWKITDYMFNRPEGS